jgi:hypothetical protein
MKVLIFNQHPDCSLYMYKAFQKLGAEIEFATEELTLKLGFPHSSTKQNKFEVVNKLFEPQEFSKHFDNIKFVDHANHDLYLSILPEVFSIFGNKAYFDAQMQLFIRQLGHVSCKKSCNHPDAENFNFKYCANWTPNQPSLQNPRLITQLITQAHMMEETKELLDLKNNGHPVIIAGADNLPDGFVRDIDILPFTSLLVHNKQFGINCYAVCKALDMGIPVYMSKQTKQLIGFDDLPDDLFLFKDDMRIQEAYESSLNANRQKIQDTFRSIYTLDRTVQTLTNVLK